MEFQYVLKELIKLTDVMVKDVSACVQYDQSYVSKWLSGAKLPADKAADTVIAQMSAFFATVIVNKRLEDDLRQLVPVPLDMDHAGDVENVVKALLQDAYYHSASLVDPEQMMLMTHRVVNGRNASIQFSLDVIKRHLSNHHEHEEIVCTIDLFSLLPDLNLETFNVVTTRPLQLTMHTVLDMKRQEEDYEKRIRSLLAFLNQTINVDYYIYEDLQQMRNNVIVMKNHFVLFYYLDESGKVAACQYVDDSAFVEMAYYDAMAQLDHNNLLLKATSGQKLRNIDYDVDFVASPPYTLMASGAMGLFLEPEMLQDHRELFSEKNFRNALFINDLTIQQVYTEPVEILTSRAYVLHFFKTGRVNYLGQVFYLKPEDRGKYVRAIIRAIQTNPNFNLRIVQDDLSPFYTSKINISLMMTKNKALVLKSPEALFNNRYPYYMITDQRFVDILAKYVEWVKSYPAVRRIEREDTEELLEHYLSMFRL